MSFTRIFQREAMDSGNHSSNWYNEYKEAVYALEQRKQSHPYCRQDMIDIQKELLLFINKVFEGVANVSEFPTIEPKNK